MAQIVGGHTAQIDILLREHRQTREDVEAVRKDVHEIRNMVDSYVSSVKGGWKVLLAIGILLVSFVQVLGWVAERLTNGLSK